MWVKNVDGKVNIVNINLPVTFRLLNSRHMSDNTASASKRLSKKQARRIVYDKLATALAEYRAGVKEKKFSSNLKKASKLFAADIAKAVAKQKQKIQKPTKIKAVKNSTLVDKESASEAVV